MLEKKNYICIDKLFVTKLNLIMAVKIDASKKDAKKINVSKDTKKSKVSKDTKKSNASKETKKPSVSKDTEKTNVSKEADTSKETKRDPNVIYDK